MVKILALSDSDEDIRNLCGEAETYLFRLGQLPPEEYTPAQFENIYAELRSACDLASIDLVIAEYVDSLPLLYLMRRDGYSCPALMVPHTNPYPLSILFAFLLIAQHPHPDDVVICGSSNAARAYEHITGISAENICTFGVKDLYRPMDQRECREALGLPVERPLLLYTGRFMNDKGLGRLLTGYERLREKDPRCLLAMSVTHLDSSYYNALAPRMREVILFQRLEKERTALLYNAADLFVSGATSVFETYGKSPLEALACGVPVVVPRWDGFPYYLDETTGGLVDVKYVTEPQENPFEFAHMCDDHFAEECLRVLSRTDLADYVIPDWARYEHTMEVLTRRVHAMASGGSVATTKHRPHSIDTTLHPRPVRAILEHYDLVEVDDLFVKAHALGLFNGSDAGDRTLLRDLHHTVFRVMDTDRSHV